MTYKLYPSDGIGNFTDYFVLSLRACRRSLKAHTRHSVMFSIPTTREQPNTRIEKLSICIATFSSAILAPVMASLVRSVKIIERRTSIRSPAKWICFAWQRPGFELVRIPFRYYKPNHVFFWWALGTSAEDPTSWKAEVIRTYLGSLSPACLFILTHGMWDTAIASKINIAALNQVLLNSNNILLRKRKYGATCPFLVPQNSKVRSLSPCSPCTNPWSK